MFAPSRLAAAKHVDVSPSTRFIILLLLDTAPCSPQACLEVNMNISITGKDADLSMARSGTFTPNPCRRLSSSSMTCLGTP